MVAKKMNSESDWPPKGWKVQIKVSNGRNFKCYIHSKTGRKLYSKLAVQRYIKDQSVGKQGSHTKKGHAEMSSGKKQMRASGADDSLELPPGWIIECRTRKSGAKEGTKYKCFIDPSTGSKFFSKPEVYRYLESLKRSTGSSGPKGGGSTGSSGKKGGGSTGSSGKKGGRSTDTSGQKGGGSTDTSGQKGGGSTDTSGQKGGGSTDTSGQKGGSTDTSGQKGGGSTDTSGQKGGGSTYTSGQKGGGSIRHSSSNVVIERTIDEELPSGWIKEMRCKMRDNKVVRRDPFYFDPGSPLVFRSKLEVLRYVETGEVSRHAYRRKNRSINSEEFVVEKTLPTSSDEKGKTGNGTRKQLSADELSSKPSISRLRGAEVRRITRSSTRASPVSVDQAYLEQSASLTESVNMAQEMLPKEAGRMTELALPIVQDDGREDDATHKPREASTTPSRAMIEEISDDLSPQGHSNGKFQTHKRKRKDRKSPIVPFRSSKRLAGVDAEVVFHSIPIEHARLAMKRKSSKTTEAPSLGMIPSESQKRTQALDAELPNELGSKEQARALDIDDQTVLATQEDSLNKTDSLTQESAQEMAQSKDQALPSFSENPNFEVLQSNIDQLVEYPTDTVPQGKFEIFPGVYTVPEVQAGTPAGSKIENSLDDRPVLKDQPGSVERDTEFCYPSPLWTDACLEFAFKTLTGAIPLDDNLAIDDYIQHQLRTSSKQSNNNRSIPDMGVPSFFQNDETKSVSPLQDVSFPNSNGFPNTKQVNDK